MKTSKKPVADFLLLHSSPIQQELKALGLLLVALLLFRFEALRHFSTHVLGGSEGDAGLYLWLIKSNCRDLFSLPWFNTNSFYPYSQSLAWSDNFVLPSLVAAPFLLAGAPLVPVFNGLMLLASLLTGYTTYRLALLLFGQFSVALAIGASFMTFPYFTAHAGHPQLQFAFWIPLTLLALFRFLAKPNIGAAFLTGLSIALSFMCTVYYALFLVLLVPVVFLAVVLLKPHQFQRQDLALFATGCCIGLCPIAPVALPYLAVRGTFGERAIYEAFYFAASGLSYLSSSAFSLLYSFSSSWTHPEATLFPGLAILVLSLGGTARMWGAQPLKNPRLILLLAFVLVCLASTPTLPQPISRYVCTAAVWIFLFMLVVLNFRLGRLERKLGFAILTNRDLAAIFLSVAAVFFALSLGPLGNPEKGQFALGFYRLVYEIIPGFNAMRAISRAGIVTIFALHMCAAFSLSFLAEKKHIGNSLLLLVSALLLIENLPRHYPLEPLKERPLVLPYLDQQTDKRHALAILPLTGSLNPDGSVASWSEFARYNTNYMNWAFETGLPLVNGYSGQRTKLMKEFPGQLLGFPDQRSLSQLQTIAGLRYVVYVGKNDPAFNKSTFEHKIQQFLGGVRLLMSDTEDNYLFELIGEQRLRGDMNILAPALPRGVLYVELKVPYQKATKEVKVVVWAPDYSQEKPLSSITLKTSGEWETFRIDLPQPEDIVRPIRLLLKPEGDASVYLRSTTFEKL
ncbi:MAG: glycosyltransferase family 39 protein [Oligoflexia bacterium]|nr:glycosyltransferase family 39 protein [Oligoflexia bacterium]